MDEKELIKTSNSYIREFKVKDDNSLVEIKELQSKKEEYSKFINEVNISKLCNLQLVEREFTIVDPLKDEEIYKSYSLAFDTRKNVFVIIVCKYRSNYYQTDQVLSYIHAVHESKFEIMYAYNKQFNNTLDVKDVKWDKTAVIIVGTNFTDDQKHSCKILRRLLLDRLTVLQAKIFEDNRFVLIDFFL